MNLEQWIVTIRESYNRHGKTWSKEKEGILRTTIKIPQSMNDLHELKNVQLPNTPELLTQQPMSFDETMVRCGVISLAPIISDKFPEICEELTDILFKEFFQRVSKEETFGDENRIEKTQQDMLGQYYSSHGPFVNMSRTFLTFTIEIKDMFPASYDVVAAQILNSVLTNIRGIFFPSDGPCKKPPLSERIKVQEDILKLYAPTFDRESFLKNNPVLNKPKAEEAKWPGFVCILIFLERNLYSATVFGPISTIFASRVANPGE